MQAKTIITLLKMNDLLMHINADCHFIGDKAYCLSITFHPPPLPTFLTQFAAFFLNLFIYDDEGILVVFAK